MVGVDLRSNRAMLVERLAEVELNLTLGQKHIDEQYRLIAELARERRDTSMSHDFLHHLLETQALHEEERNRIIAELTKENYERPRQ